MGLTYDIEKDSLYQKGLAKGEEKGKLEGRQEGEHQKAVATAEKCLIKGLNLEETAEITDLSLAELKKIAKRLEK